MTWTFSKRFKNVLKEDKLHVSIPKSVRIRLLSAFKQYDTTIREQNETGYWYNYNVLDTIKGKLKSELGLESFLAYPENGIGEPKSSNFESFILRGNYPPHLFDTIELFYNSRIEDTEGFQWSINEIMEESDLPWRMANGKIFPIDSSYIEEVITKKAYSLLREVKFCGALEEFEKARVDLTNRDFSGAIQNAFLALESTKKGVLDITKMKPGQLTRKLIDSGIIPEYYTGFLKSFEENILRSPDIIRNEELDSGHGQGKEINRIPKSLAELSINLSAVLINFLIKRYLEHNIKNSIGETDPHKPRYEVDEADIPF